MITLVPETGAKLTNANTYVSLAEADAYHANLANDEWTGNTDDEARKQALIIATQSVDLLYGARYVSMIYPDSAQALLFPRLYFIDSNARIVKENTIPSCLKNAVCEIALMQLAGEDVFPQPSLVNAVKSKSVKAGDISTSTEYFLPAKGESFNGFGKVDIILRPILKSTSKASWRLVA